MEQSEKPRGGFNMRYGRWCAVHLTAVTAAVALETVTIRPAGTAQESIHRDNLAGTCLPIWNSAARYEQMRAGLAEGGFSLLRFPNGSMSNDYHWNGSGAYDAEGIWIAGDTYAPGFVAQSRWRGTSKHHYGWEVWSKVTDGDTATMWWSDPFVQGTEPWLYLEFGEPVSVDSVCILWGDEYAVDFALQCWTAAGVLRPGPHAAWRSRWKDAAAVSGNTARVSRVKITSPISSHYLQVVVKRPKNADRGVQIREIYAYGAGVQHTVNIPRYRDTGLSQTRVVAGGAHPGNEPRPGWDSTWVDWDFETFMRYVRNMPRATQPVICVNYGTGTPEEAAAWVRYANVIKGYGIRYWQVGNEMDGAWEEGGPISATMYAEKYIRFAKAMKAVDPAIYVFGPVLSTADFNRQGSGDFNDSSWMETFLARVGEAERNENARYLDGVDFHCYPYWFSSRPVVSAMLSASDFIAVSAAGLLNDWMRAHLPRPDSVLVFLSEYNASVVMTSVLQQAVNGLVIANMFGSMAEAFGGRAMAVIWDGYEAPSQGPDGTYGSLSLFTPSVDKAYTSMTPPPSAAWWGAYAAQTLWLKRGEAARLAPVTYDRTGGLRVFAVERDDGRAFLMVNIGADTAEARFDTALGDGGAFADVYTWGQREFKWIGAGPDAYAAPNCGPSSRRIAPPPAAIRVAPRSLAVVDVARAESAGSVHVVNCGAYPRTIRGGDTCRVWACGRSDGSVITNTAYSIDDETTWVNVPPLDGAADGPMENIVFSPPLGGLNAGVHVIRFRFETSAGAVALDSAAFLASAGDSILPARKRTGCRGCGSGGLRIMQRSAGGVRMVWAEQGTYNAIAIYDVRGRCVHRAGLDRGRQWYEWPSLAQRFAGAGFYFVELKGEGYNARTVIGAIR